MPVQITVEVSAELGEEIKPYHNRIAELLERGLRDVKSEESGEQLEVDEILEVLATQPTAQQILAIRPSQTLQERMSYLLDRAKSETLSTVEQAELERYLMIEHLVRLAKSHALQSNAGK